MGRGIDKFGWEKELIKEKKKIRIKNEDTNDKK